MRRPFLTVGENQLLQARHLTSTSKLWPRTHAHTNTRVFIHKLKTLSHCVAQVGLGPTEIHRLLPPECRGLKACHWTRSKIKQWPQWQVPAIPVVRLSVLSLRLAWTPTISKCKSKTEAWWVAWGRQCGDCGDLGSAFSPGKGSRKWLWLSLPPYVTSGCLVNILKYSFHIIPNKKVAFIQVHFYS